MPNTYHVLPSPEGKGVGPFTSGELRRLADSGKLKPEHWIRHDASGQVKQARAIAGLFDDRRLAPQPRPPVVVQTSAPPAPWQPATTPVLVTTPELPPPEVHGQPQPTVIYQQFVQPPAAHPEPADGGFLIGFGLTAIGGILGLIVAVVLANNGKRYTLSGVLIGGALGFVINLVCGMFLWLLIVSAAAS